MQEAPGEKDLQSAYQALEAYLQAGSPGYQEAWTAAGELADVLTLQTAALGLQAKQREQLVFDQAVLQLRIGKNKEALELLSGTRPKDPELAVEFPLLAAQIETSQAQKDELLLEAEQALRALQDPVVKARLEGQWCCVSALMEIARGLPDRAAAPLARGFECARAFLSAGGDRWLLDEELLAKIAMHHALIEHERVVELLRRPNPDLPPVGSLAALRMDVREGMSRAALETLGRTPADQKEREPLALLEAALSDPRLSLEDRRLASAIRVQLWLDRNDPQQAEQALEHLRSLPADNRRIDLTIPYGAELALRAGARDAFAPRRDEARREWRQYLTSQASFAAQEAELGLLHFDETTLLFRALARLDVALEGPERGARTALLELVEAQQIGPLAQALHAAPPSWQDITGLLVEGELALLHLPVREQGLLFVLSRERVEILPLATLPDLLFARRDFARALDAALLGDDAAAWNEVDRLAAELARIALPGELAQRAAKCSRLTILAPENLGYVPFEFLPGPDGQPLGLSVEVRYLPSIPVATALAGRRTKRVSPAPGPEVALLCAERPAALDERTFEPLPASPAALARLLEAYPTAKRELRTGERASRAGLEELLASNARVLQIFAHGSQDRRQVRPASLVLAKERLTAEAAEQLRFPALVVLAACGAWDGARRRGDDGRTHLPSAVLLGGADTVIAAQTPLLFGPALDFFAAFHRDLRAGQPTVRALRSARSWVHEHSQSRRERALSCLIHVVGLGDVPLF